MLEIYVMGMHDPAPSVCCASSAAAMHSIECLSFQGALTDLTGWLSAPHRPHPDTSQVQRAAEARLPQEPPDSSASACRIAIRLPDGQRLQRRFDGLKDTVQVSAYWGGGGGHTMMVPHLHPRP